MSSRRRWIPKKKRRHEDEGQISNWQAVSCGDTSLKSKQTTDKQLKDKTINLGFQHRALNTKVNDAFANQVDFDNAIGSSEVTELDKLFKIDLAAKYKNVDYLLEMLKSGDSLYTARTLKKGEWLFGNEYSNIFNPDYLHKNIFPAVSMRIKRKILKAAAKNITDPDRAAQFYHCCMKEKMTNTACTCLLYTSEAFKLDILQKKEGPVSELKKKDIVFIRFLVGISFPILKAFLNILTVDGKINSTVRQFKHLYYSESNTKYLDIAETFISTSQEFETDKFDVKLSESIMKNHRERVLTKPEFYVNTVNTEVLVKYTTIEDAKIYAAAILPDTVREFWSRPYYITYQSVFKIVPEERMFEFLKNVFVENYPNTEFEMRPGFYKHCYYTIMTAEERQEWAFRHLKSQKSILAVGNDYTWYRFIKFELTFPKMKELIKITKKAEIRSKMVLVMLESAQNNRDLELLFVYYHKRHLNELRTYRDSFLKAVIFSHHNVFKFDKLCWVAFYELLLSMNIYNTDYQEETYKTVTLLYHILNEEPFPEELMKYFLDDFDVDYVDDHLSNVGQENYQKLNDFFFDAYIKNIVKFKHQPHSNDVAVTVNRYFTNIKTSMATFHEELNATRRNNHKKIRNIDNTLSDRQLLRDLKKNKNIVINKVLDVKKKYENSPFRLNNFLKKINIYFPGDITNIYLDMFESLVNDNKDLLPVKAGVYGIFSLGDSKDKIDLMNKYAPVSAKIDRKNINIGQLRIQRSICRYACISRPPLPLSSIVIYMKGSYAKYCLRVFNTYLATLPLPICLEFVNLIIDAPISIQKHAIRLAFQCFNPESLIKVITDLWEKTRNVSMRSVVYKALFNKVVDTKNQMFFDVLLKFTSSLHQNDDNELFDIVVSNKVSEDFRGDYIEDVWKAIGSFEDKQPNIKRKEDVIRCIQDNLHLLRKTFVLMIIQEHTNIMVKENKLKLTYAENDKISQIYKENWKLIARYIMHYTRSESPYDEYVEIAHYIVQNSIVKWNEVIADEFVHQKFLWDFSTYLREASFKNNIEYFEDGLPILEDFLTLIKSSLPFYDTYKITWDLELAVISRKVVKYNKDSIKQKDVFDVIFDTAKDFSQRLGKLVSILAKNKTYIMSYSSNIKEMVTNHMRNILNVILYYDNDEYDEDENLEYALVTLAAGLVKFNFPETYMLAVQLLPTDSEEENFMYIIDKLHKCSNPDVRLALYQKFRKFCKRSCTSDYNKTSIYNRLCIIL